MVTFKYDNREQYEKYINMINNNYNFCNIRKHCRSITVEEFTNILELPQEYQPSFKDIEEIPASLGLSFFSKLENVQNDFAKQRRDIILRRMEQKTPYIIPKQEPLHVADDDMIFYMAKTASFITESQIKEFTIKRDNNLKFIEGENFSQVFKDEMDEMKKMEVTKEKFANECYIDTSTVCKIFKNKVTPNKIQLNRMCIGFHMEAKKAIEAFERCKGVDSLSSASLTDIIMLYFLEEKNYNVDEYIYNCLEAFDWFRQDPPRYFPTL